jgi:hypothetical protein
MRFGLPQDSSDEEDYSSEASYVYTSDDDSDVSIYQEASTPFPRVFSSRLGETSSKVCRDGRLSSIWAEVRSCICRLYASIGMP